MSKGVGSFTIVDHEKVVEADLGNNFFVTQESLGQPRAQVVCELLQEMNADANGNWREEVREYAFPFLSFRPSILLLSFGPIMDATPHHFHWFLLSAALPVSLCCCLFRCLVRCLYLYSL